MVVRLVEVPAIRTPARIALQVARLTADVSGAPLVPEDQLEALLRKLADRYLEARKGSESGEAGLVARFNRGQHSEFRWKGDEVL